MEELPQPVACEVSELREDAQDNMEKNSKSKLIGGQIQIGLGVISAAAFLIGALTLAVNSYLKSGEAIDRVSSVEGDIKEIKTNVKWIKEILDAWK